MTLTKFMARSTWVACASELGKLLKCHLKEKANRKLANGQNIEDSEKRKWPKGLSAPALELNTIIFKHVYWYMQLISGERLQDHWSSGYIISLKYHFIAHTSSCFSGYRVEKYDMEKGRWDPVKTVRTPECKVPKLLEGHKYKFRVVAESPNGDSEPLETDEPITAKNPFGKLL